MECIINLKALSGKHEVSFQIDNDTEVSLTIFKTIKARHLFIREAHYQKESAFPMNRGLPYNFLMVIKKFSHIVSIHDRHLISG